MTVFFIRIGAFLRSEMTFPKLLVQPPHHKSSFSFFLTNCDCFGTFMQLIMLLKMYHKVLCAIVLPLKTSSH